MVLRPFALIPFVIAVAAYWPAQPIFAQNPAEKPVSFHNDVHPIFQRKCQGCHQPAKANGKLVLTTFDQMMNGGEGGAVVAPGKPDESTLVEQLVGDPPAMPKNAPPLSPKELAVIKRWIAEGARDDTPPAAKDPIDQDHPPVYAAPPAVSALAFSPDGSTLAVSGYREVLLHRSDGSSGSSPIARLVGLSHRIESIAFSPDGETIAVVGGQPAVFGEVQLWNARTHKLQHSEMIAYDSLFGVAFAPDGQSIAMGCADKSARVVDVASGKQRVKIEQHDDWCFGAAFSLDGKHVVTPGRDRHLKLMESSTGSFIDNITSITPGVLGGSLYFVARHPTRNEFLTGGDDGVPKRYQMLRTKGRQIGDDFNLLRNYEKMPGRLTCGAFSKDGSKLVVGGFGEARIYELDGKLVAKLAGHRGAVFAVAFHPNGNQVAAGGFDGQVRIYDVATGNLVTSFVPVPVGGQVARR